MSFNKEKVAFDLSILDKEGKQVEPKAAVDVSMKIKRLPEEAVEAARENAELNGLHNCEFIAGDVLKVLDGIEDKPDMIVLDPPRDGVNPKALKKIINYGVDNILYISCKPTSLARDLEMLTACGYKPVRICAIDQFPATVHVETVALLSKLSMRHFQMI